MTLNSGVALVARPFHIELALNFYSPFLDSFEKRIDPVFFPGRVYFSGLLETCFGLVQFSQFEMCFAEEPVRIGFSRALF